MRTILPLLAMPLTICMVLAIAGVVLRRRWLVVTGIVLLYLTSIPLVSGPFMRVMEGWAERVPAAGAPHAGAIVVLSTGRSVAPGSARIDEWTDADRFFAGVELFKAGKAPLLIFTGSVTSGAAALEGNVLAKHAREDFGLPVDRVLVTPSVINTEDEAREVAKLIAGRPGVRPVLLVTSAFHMHRAQGLFERAGVPVIPFRVDFQAGPDGGGLSLGDFVPSASSLARTQLAWREAYGRAFYRVFGP